jgi:hypothetical protein
MGGNNDWADEPVGNSSDNKDNYMRNIGCGVTGSANAANTLNGSDLSPQTVNATKTLFSTIGTDDKKSDIDFKKFASSQSLNCENIWSSFGEKLKELDNNATSYAVLAKVLYKDGSSAGHYIGVNNISGDYVEIAPTSNNDTNSKVRRDDWKFENGKVLVPIKDVLRLVVFSKGQ